MAGMRFIYDDDYDLRLGAHVFPSQKYRLIHERLVAEGIAAPEDFVTPAPANDDDMLLVHTPEWVRKLKTGSLSYAEILTLEIPYSRQIMDAFWLVTGGTILACRTALEQGVCYNVGGGFHHAFTNHGEGFCPVNDIAVGIRTMQRDGIIRRSLVIDCDVHHGNGTAEIFAGDDSVFTLSIHQYNNYPWEKPLSDVDVHLDDGVSDAEYLERLRNGCNLAFSMCQPELLVYVAGADPFCEDVLGGLALTRSGLYERDLLVLESAQRRGVPVAIVLAGGYAADVDDTVAIHCNTARAAQKIKPG